MNGYHDLSLHWFEKLTDASAEAGCSISVGYNGWLAREYTVFVHNKDITKCISGYFAESEVSEMVSFALDAMDKLAVKSDG
jgi:hypothetical protein